MNTVTEVAGGVYRLGTDHVGWYLIVDDRICVVDCGFVGYYDQLPESLGQLGRRLDEVDAVVLTHHHTDHVGAAERIRTETGARVFAPAADAPEIRGERRVKPPPGLISNVWRPAMLGYLAHVARNRGTAIKPVKELTTYEDGDLLDVPGRLRVIHTPGHTAGHCALSCEERGVLFAGDALCTYNLITGRSGPQIAPVNENSAQALASIERLTEVHADVVVVGHGDPFQGTPAEAVEAARSGAEHNS